MYIKEELVCIVSNATAIWETSKYVPYVDGISYKMVLTKATIAQTQITSTIPNP